MSKIKETSADVVNENGGNVTETPAPAATGKGKGKPETKKPAKKEKKLLSTFEFARAGAVAMAIRQLRLTGQPEKLNASAEKIIALADKIYTEKTGAPSNLKESKWNFLYATRFLKYYEAPVKK